MASVLARAGNESRRTETLIERYRRIRSATLAICEPLDTEDFVVQSMPDASPAKWHLAHTSWFFEQFVLKPHDPDYVQFDARFDYLFNSYYQSVGPMHQRPQRGLITRPAVREIFGYRSHVDEHMDRLLERTASDERIHGLVVLGLNHEQQHQELMFTDLKHLLFCNPLRPAYRAAGRTARTGNVSESRFVSHKGGVFEIGATQSFCFDNELPRHRVLVEPYALANRLVTNGEYLEFVRDGGYRRADFWLADGWSTVCNEGWSQPFYWSESLDSQFTLAGTQPLDLAEPVSHLSYYEADACARWAGARLPTEAEWELAASTLPVAGNLLHDVDGAALQPQRAVESTTLAQIFGDVWEWTSSSYSPYPGYRVPAGAIGEYNGKFMCNQMVLRGGSCVTPADHVRASYRNFFYPTARWQFMGVRLARDL